MSNGNVPEKKHGSDAIRIGIVVLFDQLPDLWWFGIASNVISDHKPTIADQVPLQSGEFLLQFRGAGLVNDQEHNTAIFGHRHANTGVKKGWIGMILHRPVFVASATHDIGIGEIFRRSW